MAALISYRNLADAGVTTSTAPTVVDYPLANLKDRPLSKRARWSTVSSGIAEVEMIVDIGDRYAYLHRVRCAAILGVNVAPVLAGSDIQIQLQAYGGPSGSGPWTLAFGGSLADRSPATSPGNIIVAANNPDGERYRYWRLVASWTTRDSYAEIGRLWLGNGILFELGADGDWTLSADDSGTVTTSAGRQAYQSKGVTTRRLNCSVTGMDSTIAFGFATDATMANDVPSMQALQAEAGTSGEVIMTPRTSSLLWMRRLGVYGRITDPINIQKLAGEYYGARITMVEER